jgi:hypothetical protein
MLAARRQDQHPGARVGREHAAGDIDAGDVGQLKVEHDHVRPY